MQRRPGGRQVIPRPDGWSDGPPPPWGRNWAPSLGELIEALAAPPVRSSPDFPEARPSAVLVVLAATADGPEVLLTRRSADMRTHRGEVSFPGGRLDPGETVVEAALREAHEEVGLDPALVTVRGELDHLSTPVSRSSIAPLVATVEHRLDLQPHTGEVDRVLWVPISELTRPDTYRAEVWSNRPADWVLHFFELDDETVWGATARMLFDLLCRAL